MSTSTASVDPGVPVLMRTPPPSHTLPAPQQHSRPAGSRARSAIRNAFTIDVEEWFQVSAFEHRIAREHWGGIDSRLEGVMRQIMSLLERRGVRATFFTLGWIAERHGALIREVAEQGHEIASHGFDHRRVTALSPQALREDVIRTRTLLEQVSGQAVTGYRAPSFSVSPDTLWIYDVLAETGHRYSSSIFPIAHDHYGIPDAPRFAHARASGIVEIPPTTVVLGGRNLPAAGGGYFRLLPYGLSRAAIRRMHARDGEPAVFYFHPWEIDADQPRMTGVPARTRFRHYVNLSRMLAKLDRLLVDFHWGRMDEVFADRIGGR
jgi:polysaccharide deacetylase family protein (PEP-CTERM system associated)